jgi:hypothetical protein
VLTSALYKPRYCAVWDENKVPDTVDDAAQTRAAHDAHPGILEAFRELRLYGLDGGIERCFLVFFWHVWSRPGFV